MNNLKLYEEIKSAYSDVMEAEENAAGWKAEARERMKDVNTLIAAAEKVNKTKIDRKTLLNKIRKELTPDETPEVSPADTDGNNALEDPANTTD